MREQFRAHYPMSEQELSDLWENATIIFDTNALLNLFRYPAETRDDFLSLLEDVKDRLWIPHQVGAEFHRRRLGIPTQQNQALKDFDSVVNKSREQIKSSLNGFQRHMPAKARELEKLIDSQLKTLRNDVKSKFEDYKNDVLATEAHDETFQKITELYDGRVGEPFDPKKIIEIQSEGEQRYRLLIPPGYEDVGKNSNQFGDLIIWYQILDYAQKTKRPVFFVTDDETEDWWTIVNTRPVEARQELVDEFLGHSSGKAIKFYLPADFLKDAQQHGKGVKEETVEEVTTYADERRKALQDRLFSGGPSSRVLNSSEIVQLLRSSGSSEAIQNALDAMSNRSNNRRFLEIITESGLQDTIGNAHLNLTREVTEALEFYRNANLWSPQDQDDEDDEFHDEDDSEDWDADTLVDENEDNPSDDESSTD